MKSIVPCDVDDQTTTLNCYLFVGIVTWSIYEQSVFYLQKTASQSTLSLENLEIPTME